MVRLKLRKFEDSREPRRIESDRESLHFPQGGVFGLASPADHTRLVEGLDQTLHSMQRQLDALRREVDASLHIPGETPGDRPPPHRAA